MLLEHMRIYFGKSSIDIPQNKKSFETEKN